MKLFTAILMLMSSSSLAAPCQWPQPQAPAPSGWVYRMHEEPYGNTAIINCVVYGAMEGAGYLDTDQGVFLIPATELNAAIKYGLVQNDVHPIWVGSPLAPR